MYSKATFVFIILLLGLILCSFFSCGKEGMTGTNNQNIDLITNKIFYGPNGGYAEIINNNGNYYIEIKDTQGNKTQYIYSSTTTTPTTTSTTTPTTTSTTTPTTTPNLQDITFKGPTDGNATVVVDANGNYTIIITYSNGEKIVYYPDITASGTTTNGNSNSNFQNTLSNYFPSISTPSTYQNNTPPPPQQNSQLPNPYSSSLQPGISINQIPSGDEDLYILKSSIVPPVCPVCPSATCPKNKKDCPACPACARCPEPSFECKKVPNYSQGTQNQLLPMASLNDFTTFGS